MWAALAVARFDLRERRRSWLALVLLVALAGSVVMLAIAGGRRTDTAYERFLRSSSASDVVVSPAGTGFPGYYRALADLPGAVVVGKVAGVTAFPLDKLGRPEVLAPPFVYLAADTTYGEAVDRLKLLAGRMPRSRRADEIVVDQTAARTYRVKVGSILRLAVPRTASSPGPPTSADSVLLHETVVGVAVTRTDVVAITPLDSAPYVLGTPALLAQVLPAIGGPTNDAFDAAYVRLDRTTSLLRFDSAARALAQRFPETRGQVFVANEVDQARAVERAIHPEAIALYLFALIIALAALVVVGQVASRQVFEASLDHPTLRGLGMSRYQLAAARLLEVAAAALVGAALAIGVAVALSPLTPLGPARLAEPQPGLEVNAPVLGLGAAAIVLLLVAVVGWTAWRLAGAHAPGEHSANVSLNPSRVGTMVSRTPVTVGLGIRMALDPGRGSASVPVRSAISCTAIAVLAVTAALIFGANLTRLVTTAHLYGRNWDVMLDPQSGFSSVSPSQATRLLSHLDHVVAWSYGDHGEVEVAGQRVAAIGVDPGKGPLLFPTLLEGHPPHGPNQIVLGTKTLRRTGHHVGDAITVTIDGSRQTMRVVGRAVFPAFGQGAFTPTDLGEGAATRIADLVHGSAGPGRGYNFVLVRFAETPALTSDVRRLGSSFAATMGLTGCKSEACGFFNSQRPTDIADYARVEATPIVLAAVLGVLGLAVLTQLLFISTRRRRRDIAIVRALGLSGPQASMAVVWQAMILALVAMGLGVPLGIAAGRWIWQLFANAVGVSTAASIPVVVPILAAPIVLLAANAAAAFPSLKAGRLPPATVLRIE
jgi:ABC-type lipoprotein release transport system permease subunit